MLQSTSSLNLYTAYLNCVEVAGLDYEKVWLKVLGHVIYHLAAPRTCVRGL